VPCLLDRLEVISGAWLRGFDLEEIGAERPTDLTFNDARTALASNNMFTSRGSVLTRRITSRQNALAHAESLSG
jgi:hypothetical protein